MKQSLSISFLAQVFIWTLLNTVSFALENTHLVSKSTNPTAYLLSRQAVEDAWSQINTSDLRAHYELDPDGKLILFKISQTDSNHIIEVTAKYYFSESSLPDSFEIGNNPKHIFDFEVKIYPKDEKTHPKFYILRYGPDDIQNKASLNPPFKKTFIDKIKWRYQGAKALKHFEADSKTQTATKPSSQTPSEKASKKTTFSELRKLALAMGMAKLKALHGNFNGWNHIAQAYDRLGPYLNTYTVQAFLNLYLFFYRQDILKFLKKQDQIRYAYLPPNGPSLDLRIKFEWKDLFQKIGIPLSRFRFFELDAAQEMLTEGRKRQTQLGIDHQVTQENLNIVSEPIDSKFFTAHAGTMDIVESGALNSIPNEIDPNTKLAHWVSIILKAQKLLRPDGYLILWTELGKIPPNTLKILEALDLTVLNPKADAIFTKKQFPHIQNLIKLFSNEDKTLEAKIKTHLRNGSALLVQNRSRSSQHGLPKALSQKQLIQLSKKTAYSLKGKNSKKTIQTVLGSSDEENSTPDKLTATRYDLLNSKKGIDLLQSTPPAKKLSPIQLRKKERAALAQGFLWVQLKDSKYHLPSSTGKESKKLLKLPKDSQAALIRLEGGTSSNPKFQIRGYRDTSNRYFTYIEFLKTFLKPNQTLTSYWFNNHPDFQSSDFLEVPSTLTQVLFSEPAKSTHTAKPSLTFEQTQDLLSLCSHMPTSKNNFAQLANAFLKNDWFTVLMQSTLDSSQNQAEAQKQILSSLRKMFQDSIPNTNISLSERLFIIKLYYERLATLSKNATEKTQESIRDQLVLSENTFGIKIEQIPRKDQKEIQKLKKRILQTHPPLASNASSNSPKDAPSKPLKDVPSKSPNETHFQNEISLSQVQKSHALQIIQDALKSNSYLYLIEQMSKTHQAALAQYWSFEGIQSILKTNLSSLQRFRFLEWIENNLELLEQYDKKRSDPKALLFYSEYYLKALQDEDILNKSSSPKDYLHFIYLKFPFLRIHSPIEETFPEKQIPKISDFHFIAPQLRDEFLKKVEKAQIKIQQTADTIAIEDRWLKLAMAKFSVHKFISLITTDPLPNTLIKLGKNSKGIGPYSENSPIYSRSKLAIDLVLFKLMYEMNPYRVSKKLPARPFSIGTIEDLESLLGFAMHQPVTKKSIALYQAIEKYTARIFEELMSTSNPKEPAYLWSMVLLKRIKESQKKNPYFLLHFLLPLLPVLQKVKFPKKSRFSKDDYYFSILDAYRRGDTHPELLGKLLMSLSDEFRNKLIIDLHEHKSPLHFSNTKAIAINYCLRKTIQEILWYPNPKAHELLLPIFQTYQPFMQFLFPKRNEHVNAFIDFLDKKAILVLAHLIFDHIENPPQSDSPNTPAHFYSTLLKQQPLLTKFVEHLNTATSTIPKYWNDQIVSLVYLGRHHPDILLKFFSKKIEKGTELEKANALIGAAILKTLSGLAQHHFDQTLIRLTLDIAPQVGNQLTLLATELIPFLISHNKFTEKWFEKLWNNALLENHPLELYLSTYYLTSHHISRWFEQQITQRVEELFEIKKTFLEKTPSKNPKLSSSLLWIQTRVMILKKIQKIPEENIYSGIEDRFLNHFPEPNQKDSSDHEQISWSSHESMIEFVFKPLAKQKQFKALRLWKTFYEILNSFGEHWIRYVANMNSVKKYMLRDPSAPDPYWKGLIPKIVKHHLDWLNKNIPELPDCESQMSPKPQ